MAKGNKWTLADLKNKPGIKSVAFQDGKHEEATGKVTIVFSDHIRGMNGPEGLIREHWAKAIKRKDIIKWLIAEQTKARFPGKVKITYENRACKLMDWDNFCASFKHIGDALQDNDVIIDDKPEIVVIFKPVQTKVKKRSDEIKVVTIEPYKEN